MTSLKLSRLHIEGFQSIRNPVTLDFAALTLLFGANSSGKSAIGDAIRTLADFLNHSFDFKKVARDIYKDGEVGKLILGVGCSVGNHANFPEILNRLEVPDYSHGIAESDPLEDVSLELWAASSIFEFSTKKIVDFRELDVLIKFCAAPFEVDEFSISLGGDWVYKIEKKGAVVRVRRPQRCEINSKIYSVFNKIEELSDELLHSMDDGGFFILKKDDEIEFRYLFEPFDYLGLRSGFSIGNTGFDFETSNYEFIPNQIYPDIKRTYDDDSFGDPFLELIWENLGPGMNADSQLALSSLRQIFSGAFVVSSRTLGALLGNCLRLGPVRKVPATEELNWKQTENHLIKRARVDDRPAQTRRAAAQWYDGLEAWKTFSFIPEVKYLVNKYLSQDFLNLPYRVSSRLSRFTSQEINVSKDWDGLRKKWGIERWLGKRRNKIADPSRFLEEEVPQVSSLLLDLNAQRFVPVSDVGTGVSQAIPVLTTLGIFHYLTFIEQPELHLHPKMQADLADVFLDAIFPLNDGLIVGRICIAETHSEHFALRILRRIRESRVESGANKLRDTPSYDFGPDMDAAVVFYYFQSSEQGTKISKIRVDSLGRFLDEWPDGFFEERVREVV